MADLNLTRVELSTVLALALPDPPPGSDPGQEALKAALEAAGCSVDQVGAVLEKMKPPEPGPTLRERVEAVLNQPQIAFTDTSKITGKPVTFDINVTP